MNSFSVSVVIETVTAREDGAIGALPEQLDVTIAAVRSQSLPPSEIIVVLDQEVPPETRAEIARRQPDAKVILAARRNYFAAKNAGAAAAQGDVVALIDGDCVPAADWLERLVSRLKQGADVVAGCTRYSGSSAAARTFSVPDFAQVLEGDSAATGILINNVAYRREVYREFPLDERVRRNGGCVLQYHQLRAAGRRIDYEGSAIVSHGLDIEGAGFVKKHFGRGFDSVSLYRADDAGVLRGTHLYRRGGLLVLPAIFARRLVTDWVELVRHRREKGLTIASIPYYAMVATALRLIELLGATAGALVPPSRLQRIDGIG